MTRGRPRDPLIDTAGRQLSSILEAEYRSFCDGAGTRN